MADAMLPLFNNMPRVRLVVRDDEAFHEERPPLAMYVFPVIVVNPNHPPTSSFNDLKGTICHELIHAWLNWRGLDRRGEFLDEHHNEAFVKKALEINKMNIDGLRVDLDYLLTNPKAIEIYTRLGGTLPSPKPQAEHIKVVKRDLLDLFGLSKNDYFLKVVLVCVLLVIVSLILSRANVIPGAVAGLVLRTWVIAALVWTSIEAWKEIGMRLSRKTVLEKRSLSWSDRLIALLSGLSTMALLGVAAWLLRPSDLTRMLMKDESSIVVFAGFVFILLAGFFKAKFNWSKKWHTIASALTIGLLVLYALVVVLR